MRKSNSLFMSLIAASQLAAAATAADPSRLVSVAGPTSETKKTASTATQTAAKGAKTAGEGSAKVGGESAAKTGGTKSATGAATAAGTASTGSASTALGSTGTAASTTVGASGTSASRTAPDSTPARTAPGSATGTASRTAAVGTTTSTTRPAPGMGTGVSPSSPTVAQPGSSPTLIGAPGAVTPALGPDGQPVSTAPQPNPYLLQSGNALLSNGNAGTFAAFMNALKTMLAQPGVIKQPAAAIIKTNPILTQLGVRVIEAGSGRIWTFPRVSFTREIIVQWFDTKATTTFGGRRHNIKHVTFATTARIQSMVLPATVNLKEGRILGGEEGAKFLILVGDEGSALWLHAFKAVDGGWVDSPDHFASVPAFLTTNVSGRVAFRGNDMIFSIGRVVPPSGTQTTNLPEAESSTYRFLLKLTDSGYQLQKVVPDLTQFATVRQYLDALAANRTDVAKSLLADSKGFSLMSIPRYVGVKGPNNAWKIVQMQSPPSGAPRYRIVTGQKDDLIFEVGKVKNVQVIRAIFIAPPDPFVQEISRILPTYEQLMPPPPAPVDAAATDTKHP